MGFAPALALALGISARASAAETRTQGSSEIPTTPAIELAPTLGYGLVRQDVVALDGSRSKRQQWYGGAQLAFRVRMTPLVSLGVVASHAECDGCAGERFSRVSFEGAFHPLHGRFFDAWGAAEVGFAFSKFAPIQPTLCANGGTTQCTSLYTDEQKRTRLGPQAGVGVGIDFLPLPYVSVGIESRAMAVLFDTGAAGVDAPSGSTPAVFAGLTLAAHLPLR